MATVAEMFPARRQPDGTVWRRSGKGAQDGWSADPKGADASYFAPGAPEVLPPLQDPSEPENVSETGNGPGGINNHDEESAVTAIDDTGDLVGPQTDWEGYPLPPEPPR